MKSRRVTEEKGTRDELGADREKQESGKDEKKVTNDRMNKDKVKARYRIRCNKHEDKQRPPATAGTET